MPAHITLLARQDGYAIDELMLMLSALYASDVDAKAPRQRHTIMTPTVRHIDALQVIT